MNKCTDLLRSVDNETDPTNMNADVGTSQFLKLVYKKSWKFKEIYLDTIRMNKSYVERNFGRNFFNNLAEMKTNGVLENDEDIGCKIYLPFTPQFFHNVNTNPDIQKCFIISYLREEELAFDNHKLEHSISLNNDYLSINKDLEEEKRHIISTKREILNYDCGILMTLDDCKRLVNSMGDITKIRYIILTSRNNITESNTLFSNYSLTLKSFICNTHIGLISKLFEISNIDKVIGLALNITRCLVTSPIDSLDGIAIVADSPECNDVMLNVVRPGVLRQYYGKNIGFEENGIINRVAYRSQVSFKSEGSDPYKMVIKPFPVDMMVMAEFFHKLLKKNKKLLNLESVDLTHSFNTCTILLYHSLKNIKKESSMGWHCDSKYSLAGNFSKQTNGQMINTPVVIFTIGSSRELHWRRRFTSVNCRGNKCWKIDDGQMEKMIMQNGTICVLNPADEKPHIDEYSKKEIHFQHGNVKVKGDNISIAYVFRVSPHICKCDIHSNKVILDKDILKEIADKECMGKVNQLKREEIYKQINVKEYHMELKNHFKLNFFT